MFKYLTKGGPTMLLDLHTKLLGKKSSSSEPLLIENVEDDEDDGNVFTLTQKITEDDKNTTYTECTQVFILYSCLKLSKVCTSPCRVII